jgi:hypothetical protein
MVDESKSAPTAPAEPAVAGVDTPKAPKDPGFLERGGLRRRLRFLRKTRELAYRDLGGLVFEMHRLGQQREDLLAGKLATLARIDTELRAIEETLLQRRGVTVLREAGVTACPRCAAIHGSEDRFCPACGFSMGGHAERPIAAPAAGAPNAQPAQPVQPSQPSQPSQLSQPSPPKPVPEEDRPTQVIDPPTQIVRPSSGESPAETGKA